MGLFGFEGDNAREKVIVLLTMCFALAMVMLDNTVVNVALPRHQREARRGRLRPPVDRRRLRARPRLPAPDRRDPRRPLRPQEMFLLGLTIFSLASLGCGVSGSTDALIAFRALAGRRRGAAPAGNAVDHHRHVPAA